MPPRLRNLIASSSSSIRLGCSAGVFCAFLCSPAEGALKSVRGVVQSIDKKAGVFIVSNSKTTTGAFLTLNFNSRTKGLEWLVEEGAEVVYYDPIRQEAEIIRSGEPTAADPESVPAPATKKSIAGKAKTSGPREAADIANAADLEREALDCVTAKEALFLYTAFLARPDLNEVERERAQSHLEEWRESAQAGQERVGKQWLDGKEALAIRKRAGGLVEQAIELIRLGNYKLAMERLSDASRVDPDSVLANSVQGIVYAIILRDRARARENFAICVKRSPNSVPALNNFGICEASLHHYDQAITRLTRAAQLAPTSQEVAQNLGKLIGEAKGGDARIMARRLEAASDLYASMVSSGKVKGSVPSKGWFYMFPGVSASAHSKKIGRKVIMAGGSGAVVAPNFVLTNRHVVEDAAELGIVDPANPKGDLLPCHVVDMAKDADLALLRCERLAAPPLPMAIQTPPRGTEIMVLGYPEFFRFGEDLKSTRGSIASAPSEALEGMLMYDAATSPGNSGGPVCDAFGVQVAVHAAGRQGSHGARYGCGLPTSVAIPFLKRNIPGFQPAPSSGKAMSWPQVDALASQSTVLIQCAGEAEDIGISAEGLVDNPCNRCNATGRIACPAKGCVGGKVRVTASDRLGFEPVQGQAIVQQRRVKKSCSMCNGKGFSVCPICQGTRANRN